MRSISGAVRAWPAAAFASIVDAIDGFDLSPGMIERARATQIYARLEIADMVQASVQASLTASVDLILAADAMVYLGDLAVLFGGAARVLMPQGLLGFYGGAACGRRLRSRAGLRYTHSEV